MHQSRLFYGIKQITRAIEHLFIRGGTRTGGKIYQGDIGFFASLCFQLPAPVTSGPAQIYNGLNASFGGLFHPARGWLIAAPHLRVNLMQIMPGQP